MKVIQNLAQVAHFFSSLNFIFIVILRRKDTQCTSIFFILLYVYLLSLADESAEVYVDLKHVITHSSICDAMQCDAMQCNAQHTVSV